MMIGSLRTEVSRSGDDSARRNTNGPVDYDHDHNLHTITGAREALASVLEHGCPQSIADFGCGRGTWLKAANELGISDVFGVDGIEAPDDDLLIDRRKFKRSDLTRPIDLGRRFDLVLCLEVAEHLEPHSAPVLIETLTQHSDTIVFSAAIPGQAGQHHVNCQWPAYWQDLFNTHGYSCSDSIRWELWDKSEVEPWYRQNCMTCTRDPELAGHEPRIRPVVHPKMVRCVCGQFSDEAYREHIRQIECGSLSADWYVTTPFRALTVKMWRQCQRLFRPETGGYADQS